MKNKSNSQKHCLSTHHYSNQLYKVVMILYTSLTDDQLVRMYENGDDSAFDALLERHQERLFNYILFLIHDEDLANDVFQDTFVRAITSIRSHCYESSNNFCSWLFRISRNLVLDHFRHHNIQTVSQELVDENGDVKGDRLNDIQFCAPTVEDEIFLSESKDTVRSLINRLPENQREIIYLRYYRDMPFKDIAEVLGISINTALGRVRYAILNMRQMASEHHLSIA